MVKKINFRLIFKPYDWSTVINWTVNISLITALLVSYSFWKLSASWDNWHKWMKKNAEVATYIDVERGSEEVNRQCCTSMRRFPVIIILVSVVLGLWPAGNIYQIR